MSVRVNLLPEATKARDRATRQRLGAGLAALLVVLACAGVYWWFAMELSDAEDQLAAEQARTAQLRGQQAELVAFSQLAQLRDRADDLLASAMADEVSVAGVLQDLAAVTPADTQFESLSIQIQPPSGDDPLASVGTLNISGRTLNAHAPGVEGVLLSLDKISTFRDLYLNSSSLDGDDERITSFSVDGRIGAEARTERYADGLPEVLR